MKRGLKLRRQKRLVTGIPSISGQGLSFGTPPRLGKLLDVNPRPEQACCDCCDNDCALADRHDDGGCSVVGHEVREPNPCGLCGVRSPRMGLTACSVCA